MSEYYDRQGNPISMDEWVNRFRDNRVAYDEIDGITISTVYLGLNHAFDEGPPLIFETMIFGGAHNEDQWRYSTEADAQEGHAAAVRMVRERGC